MYVYIYMCVYVYVCVCLVRVGMKIVALRKVYSWVSGRNGWISLCHTLGIARMALLTEVIPAAIKSETCQHSLRMIICTARVYFYCV